MAFPTPSVGDILMLSQLAWKIGCAFTAGRSGAPAEFQEVDNELKSLTTAITILAETMEENYSLVARADEKTREGLGKIVGCCKQTLDDLDAFVNQYQEIRITGGPGGSTTQRSWRQLLIRNWKKVMWTTEGEGLQSLRNKLSMHTQSINLTMQALQSRSLSRLENAINPMAVQVDNLHDKLNGNLDVKIDEMHHVILSVQANLQSSPMLWPTQPGESMASPMESPMIDPRKSRNGSWHVTPRAYSTSSSTFSGPREETPDLVLSGLSTPISDSFASQRRFSTASPRNSSVIPPDHQIRIGYPPPLYNRNARCGTDLSSRNISGSEASSRINSDGSREISNAVSNSEGLSDPMLSRDSALPPPAMDLGVEATPEYMGIEDQASMPNVDVNIPESILSVNRQRLFEQILANDAAVLCDVRGTSVDYTQPDENKVGEWRMVKACGECSIKLITRKKKISGGVRYLTSIWVLSDDRSVRMQQKLADGEEVIPYTVWGNTQKVVLRVPTELRFHGEYMDDKPLLLAKTSWINYVIDSEKGASQLQNSLMGKTLIHSVRTKRTMRLHDGIKGAFAYAEQLCNLENLRIFQDHTTGGILAMIHYSPHFHHGYLAFYMNSSRDPIRIRDDGDRTIRIKGLSVFLDQPGSIINNNIARTPSSPEMTQRPKFGTAKSSKRITGAKIEFVTEAEKNMFKDKVREVQGIFFPGERDSSYGTVTTASSLYY